MRLLAARIIAILVLVRRKQHLGFAHLCLRYAYIATRYWLHSVEQGRLPCQVQHTRSCGLSACVCAAMEKKGGISAQEAAANFWVLDKDGLITQQRSNLPDYVARFARHVGEGRGEGAGLLDVVEAVQPTVLLGLAGEADWGTRHSITLAIQISCDVTCDCHVSAALPSLASCAICGPALRACLLCRL